MVLVPGMVDLSAFVDDLSRCQDAGEIEALCLPVSDCLFCFQEIYSADKFVYGADPEFSHDASKFFSHHKEVVHHMIGTAVELLPKLRVLGRDTYRAGIQVALTHHDAAHRYQRGSRETDFFSTQQEGHCDVAAGFDLAISLQYYS